jgi:hypothetical protein
MPKGINNCVPLGIVSKFLGYSSHHRRATGEEPYPPGSAHSRLSPSSPAAPGCSLVKPGQHRWGSPLVHYLKGSKWVVLWCVRAPWRGGSSDVSGEAKKWSIGALVCILEGLWLQSRSMGGKEVDGVGCGIVGR